MKAEIPFGSGGLVGDRHDDHHLPDAAVCGERLRAVQHPALAGPDGGRAHARGVAARRRLGEAPGADVFALARAAAGTSASALRCRTAGCARCTARCARRPTARRLDRRGRALRCRCSSRAADMPAPPYASGTWIPRRPSSPRRGTSSVGKCCASSHSRTCGQDFVLRELANAAAQQLLIRGQAEIHGAPRLYYHGAGRIMSTARTALLSALILYCSPRRQLRMPRSSSAPTRRPKAARPRVRHRRRTAADRLRIRVQRAPPMIWRRWRPPSRPTAGTSCCRRRSPSSASSRTSPPAPAPIERRSTTGSTPASGSIPGAG